jgi:signal transduction histidine kinase
MVTGWRQGPRISIRAKLAAVMCIPTVVLTLVIAYEIAGLASTTEEVRRQTALAISADGPSVLVVGLQNERNWAIVELIGQEGVDGVNVPVRGYEGTRRDTDQALEGFQQELARSEDESVAAYSPAVDRLSDLQPLRQLIDAYTGPRTLESAGFANLVFEQYKQMIDPFLDGVSQVADVIDHDELRQGAVLLDRGIRQSEILGNIARQTIAAALLSPGGINERSEIGELAALRGQLLRNTTVLEDGTTGIYRSAGSEALFRGFTNAVADQVDAAIHGSFNLTTFLDTVSVPDDQQYLGYYQRVGRILQDRADDLNADATRRRWLYFGVAVLIGGAAMAAMWVVSRSVIRSLRSLTAHATDIARRRLPDAVSEVLASPLGNNLSVPGLPPVEVGSHDEVAEVATALDTVQTAALNLAVRQAVLWRNLSASFVNLGRRNQNLLRRQLTFISQLEHGETDADNLANLFHLDHLATRMRRNADSLVVLGGVDTSRPHTSPVRIADVIRAAVSEVEDYQRVRAPAVEPVDIVGRAGADIVHLLAELIDNALTYSPPDQHAEVRGLAHPAGYTLMVIDRGLGMPPDEIARANRRLAGAEPFTVAPSKYLGHYVAGHLAERHGIQVRLQGAPTYGITATVHLPAGLLARKKRDETGPVTGTAIVEVGPTVGAMPHPGNGSEPHGGVTSPLAGDFPGLPGLAHLPDADRARPPMPPAPPGPWPGDAGSGPKGNGNGAGHGAGAGAPRLPESGLPAEPGVDGDRPLQGDGRVGTG